MKIDKCQEHAPKGTQISFENLKFYLNDKSLTIGGDRWNKALQHHKDSWTFLF